ncbi:hypothetical protein N7526_004002 [Penicillium atrosanguineum]|nr:hypothetical protein N7526_004002 [Penicillium atrosanguineum]
MVNLSLYLVTDSTPAILKGRDLCTVVEEALKGEFEEAKRLLPKNAIIGISTSSVEEAQKAISDGADYLGIGTMFATPTKTNTKSVIGTVGTQAILSAISDATNVATVSIGGINHSNVQRVMYQSQSPNKSLDGVAIVSAIMAADDPKASTEEFAKLIKSPPAFALNPRSARVNEAEALIEEVPEIVRKMVEAHPFVHNMINFVVVNFVANVALSMCVFHYYLCVIARFFANHRRSGASPIMAPYGEEAPDLARLDGSLLINMGTLNGDSVSNYLKALQAYNACGAPVVYDPVGAAATEIRRNAVSTLMAGGYFDLIKGNEGEIRQVWGSNAEQQRGVDSGPSTLNGQQKARLARDLARRERNVVLMTGAVDYLSDGERVIAVENGHHYLGQVTGTGCAIGTISGCFLTAHRSDKLLAVLSGILMYEIAAENAASKEYVRGPGSFVPAFLDELYAIRTAAAKGDDSWFVGRARVHDVKV